MHPVMILTRTLDPEELERITAFYRENHYQPELSPADTILVAEQDGRLVGAVRLCLEYRTLVLRGMRVRPGLQRQGIGTRLLQFTSSVIGSRECFCIPYRHLVAFYGQIGFSQIEPAEAPPFLQERLEKYTTILGLDVVLLRRPGFQPSGLLAFILPF